MENRPAFADRNSRDRRAAHPSGRAKHAADDETMHNAFKSRFSGDASAPFVAGNEDRRAVIRTEFHRYHVLQEDLPRINRVVKHSATLD